MTKFIPSRLKIDRAKKHISDLKIVLREFGNADPYRLVSEIKPCAIESDYVEVCSDPIMMHHYRIHSSHPLPDEITLLIGDAVHNLRAALDLLVHPLIIQHGGNKQFTGFPFEEEPGNYEAALTKGKVAVLPQNLKKVLRSIEAYKGGRGEDLWHMNRLDIIDKHRLLLSVAEITGFQGGLTTTGLQFTGALSNEEPAGYLLVTKDPIIPDKEASLTFEVLLNEAKHFPRREVTTLLDDLTGQTLGVVEEFESAVFRGESG